MIGGLIAIEDIDMIASGSDHLVVDATRVNLIVGDHVTFHLDYSALISAMASPFITKVFVS